MPDEDKVIAIMAAETVRSTLGGICYQERTFSVIDAELWVPLTTALWTLAQYVAEYHRAFEGPQRKLRRIQACIADLVVFEFELTGQEWWGAGAHTFDDVGEQEDLVPHIDPDQYGLFVGEHHV
jgi:hypothetical protein